MVVGKDVFSGFTFFVVLGFVRSVLFFLEVCRFVVCRLVRCGRVLCRSWVGGYFKRSVRWTGLGCFRRVERFMGGSVFSMCVFIVYDYVRFICVLVIVFIIEWLM